VRQVAILALITACGARAAPAPLANHGGIVEPAEPPLVELDGETLLARGTWLDRPTAVTVVVRWADYGEGTVSVDGVSVGGAGPPFVVPAGRHHIEFVLPGM
jgi:hypothetical protein